MLLALTVGLAVAVALSMAFAGDAEAKNKKHHNPPTSKTVQCPNQPNGYSCKGTSGNDKMVGTNNFDAMFGAEGDDSYRGISGSDRLIDSSTTSNDTYYLPAIPFGIVNIDDSGGRSDVISLADYSVNDFTKTFHDTDADGTLDTMYLDGVAGSIHINNAANGFVYGSGKIETFKFLEGDFTPSQLP
jgi:hypothetical protein